MDQERLEKIEEALIGTYTKPGGLLSTAQGISEKLDQLAVKFEEHRKETDQRLKALEKRDGDKAAEWLKLAVACVITVLISQGIFAMQGYKATGGHQKAEERRH